MIRHLFVLAALILSMLVVARPCFAAIALADAPRYIGEELEEWEDTSATATATEALAHGAFRRSSWVRPNHGFTHSAFFYRFSVRNGTSERRAWVLDAARAWVAEVDLYRVREGVAELDGRAGALIPREKRAIASEYPAFEIALDPGEERTYVLRVAGHGPVALRGELSPRASFFERYTRGLLLWGGLYGTLVGLALYIAVVFVVLRDPQWRLAPTLVFMALVEAANHGHLARALPFTVPYLEVRVGSIAAALAICSLIEWARIQLGTKLVPRVDRLLRASQVIVGSLCLLGALALRWVAIAFAAPILAATLVMTAGIMRWRDGHAPARPFVIAASTLALPGSLACATVLGLVPVHPLTEHGDYVGALFMSILLALGASQEMRSTRTNLERKNHEVTALADDLRDQVVQRSRELRRVLERRGRSTDEPPLDVGGIFEDRYRVIGRLGEGGMGTVYEVMRLRDERRFALKVLHSAATSTTVLRLTREAEIGAKIRHPNVVSIVDVGLRDGGAPFLVMDLLRGGSLEDHRRRFGEMPWALDILRGIAAGLRALHDASVIHRDLKPSNVLMDGAVARICDFGIAKHPDDERSPFSRLTTTGGVVGTTLYMAPETVAKAAPTPAADIFAFGLIAFELLTGEYPLALFAAAALGPAVHVPAPTLARVPGLTAPVLAMLEACVAVDPATRPTASALDALLSSTPTALPAA